MNRVVCVVILAGSLLATAWACAADEAVVPAYFILVEDHNADDPSASTPSMILQVAAESDIPKPKMYSVSNQIPNTLDSEAGRDISSDNHSNSTAVSPVRPMQQLVQLRPMRRRLQQLWRLRCLRSRLLRRMLAPMFASDVDLQRRRISAGSRQSALYGVGS